ncbi:hypothetical protein V6N12_036035 [Hibiscus sabdariffa]|uniref:Uncharacterized protein n=1 Tax=Hibiscus sabdariffa TaxID=183260 RepID=A0ABR2EPX1_9ROSI
MEALGWHYNTTRGDKTMKEVYEMANTGLQFSGGQSNDVVVDSDALKSMEDEDQSVSLPVGGDADGIVMGTIEGTAILPPSRARVVAGVGDQNVSDPMPILDDVVVEVEDVIVDTSEDVIYGPWMVARSRRRQPRRENRSNGVHSTGNRLGGSRFNILPEFDSTDVTPSNNVGIGESNGVSIPDNSSFPIVVSSGGSQAPQVITHEVQNVTGSHATVSILDVANEKRRQRLAINGAKQGVGASSSGTVPGVEAMVFSGSGSGNGSDAINRS